MRNLKKVLSLVLCVAMMLSVMVVGAGAAFSDQSKIKNTEAVDACTALNIIGGYPDGSFKPEGNITRAEVTKMICVALNGGKNPAVSTNTTPTFSDVRNNANAAWAEGYIESCAAQGIVSGVGGGKFAPNGNVTGVQLAKMLLVSLGYNSDNEGFTGTAWATNVNVRAAQKGLYDGLETMDTAAAITRDNAAQMVWNALNAYEVEYKTTLVADKNGQLSSQITVQDKVGLDGKTKVTLLEDKYEADTAIGTFAGNSDVTGCKDGNIQITNTTINGATLSKTTFQFKYDLDLKYLGEEVKVLYKDSKDGVDGQLDDKDTIYGVYVTGATTVYNITKNDLQSKKENGTVRFGDKNYDVAAVKDGVEYLNQNYGASKTTASGNMTADDVANAFTALKATSADTIKFVCNDDGDIVKAYVVTYKLARVTAVNSEKISINNGVGALKFEDNDIYSGAAKDDIVCVSTLYNSTATNSAAYSVVTKAETVEGKIDSFKGTEKVTVDGKTYDVASLNKSIDSDFTDSFENQIGESVTLYTIGGIVYAAEMVTEGTKNYAVVESSDGTLNDKLNPLKVAIMKADGTEATVEVHKDSISSADTDDELTSGSIIKYTDVSNGKIKITAIENASKKSTTDDTKIYDKDTKKFDDTVTDTDAVLFVKKGNDFYKYNIRNLKDITLAANATYAKLNDGSKVAAAFVELSSKPSGSSSDTVYGIVSSENGTAKRGDDTYTSYTVDLDASTHKTVLIEGEGDTTLKEGDLVAFDVASDDIYSTSDITVYARYASSTLTVSHNAIAGYAGEYEEGSILTYYNTKANLDAETSPTTVSVDDKVIVVYVDADENEAGTDVGVVHDGISTKKNFVAVYEDDDTSKSIVAIFVADDSNIEQ